MKTIRLGRTGLQVSRVGMGGIPIQRPQMDEAIQVIKRALDLGVNLIDTSIGYGDSEIRIGKGVSGRRDEVFLATKGSWSNKNAARDSIEQSLKRLDADHIDLWQLHNVRDPQAYDQVTAPGGSYEAAIEALEAGKIGHIGLSTHNIDVALKAVSSDLFETIMFPFDFIADEATDQLVPLAREHDVGFLAMKPFAGGNIREADLAIKYLLQFDNVVPVPGIEKAEEIEEIVGIVDGPLDLSPADRSRMREIRAELGNRFCRQCMYCMPCPNGVEIWLLTYMRNLYKLWPSELFLTRPLFAEAVKTSEKCVKCGVCETKCPYNLPIRDLIADGKAFYEEVSKGMNR